MSDSEKIALIFVIAWAVLVIGIIVMVVAS